jgi:AAA domain/REase_MTES_1575/Protein of unknown function (DUF4011)
MSDSSILLTKLLDRLMAGLLNGPALNCRPHNSRQRVDLTAFSAFKDVSSTDIFRSLIGQEQKIKVVGRVPSTGSSSSRFARKKPVEAAEKPVDEASKAFTQQSALINKLRVIADDARTYTLDTGVHVLSVGFPLLALPPGAMGAEISRRVLAPIAFIPVTLDVVRSPTPSAIFECYGEGMDRVVPNSALFAWLSQLMGKPDLAKQFSDEAGTQPLREIVRLCKAACEALEIKLPEFVTSIVDEVATPDATSADVVLPTGFELVNAPRGDDMKDARQLICSAVVGLFPMANQGLIEDMKSMKAGEPLKGPAEAFVKLGASLDTPAVVTDPSQPPPLPGASTSVSKATSVQLVADADPCQKQVVRIAQSAKGVVVHGPPGTGKSQTIVNIVGDNLARSQRVLFVCDKRTALDVVLNRLNGVGLGQFCAVVHDPQKDQRDLYRSVREQLENLVDAKTFPKASGDLKSIDDQMTSLHAELSGAFKSLMMPPSPTGTSFSDLVGRWLEIKDSGVSLEGELSAIKPEQLAAQATDLRELFERGAAANYASNPFATLVSGDLGSLLARPVDEIRSSLSKAAQAMKEADTTINAAMPAFVNGTDLATQVAGLSKSAELLNAAAAVPQSVRDYWAASTDPNLRTRYNGRLQEAAAGLDRIRIAPPDFELMNKLVGSASPGPNDLQRDADALVAYIEVAGKWNAFLAIGRKREATLVLQKFGLALDVPSATRVCEHLLRLKDRVTLSFLTHELSGTKPTDNVPLPDEQLQTQIGGHVATLALLNAVDQQAGLGSLKPILGELLRDATKAKTTAMAMSDGAKRASAITDALLAIDATRLFSPLGREAIQQRLYKHEPLGEVFADMMLKYDSLESIVRCEKTLGALQPQVALAMRKLISSGTDAKGALATIEKNAIASEIRARLLADPSLQTIDSQRIATAFGRYRELQAQRRATMKEFITDLWVKRQQERMTNGAGSRLSSLGADLKRRLTMTGKNATRLRRVIEQGAETEGGDPLFELRPVWMASPETVAQLFARFPVFDVVIFDEASQCRLEEALPVLTRAKRLVVAGDEKQLPPTRFFESTATDEADDLDGPTDAQTLFEKQQSQTEDLLTASLQLQIDQAFLDVHYRSKNADLIEFSNQQFYRDRLQAIPSHPDKRDALAPVRLIRADGVYEGSENEIEAEKVVEVVKELLSGDTPPTVGIACMNVAQRDVILEALDDAAAEDDKFAKALDAARNRTNRGAFEGLFVKNLENVQGDERDHMVISTTYGPTKDGKFFQRFGPLQQQGGGRRLNVLVTRARAAVHLVTSIPATAYRSLPPVPEGSTATGGYLLFAYLKYADDLQSAYAKQQEQKSASTNVDVLATRTPSKLATALAHVIADHAKLGSMVHVGNEGFAVDVAVRDSTGRYPLGVLVDGSRFALVDDIVEWDIFRTKIEQDLGWNLMRVWSPQVFRDAGGIVRQVQQGVTQQGVTRGTT